MKKWICSVLLVCLCIGMGGCANKVDKLLEEGNYAQALVLMEEDPQSYGPLYDEVRFQVARTAFDSKDYAYAATLLTDNSYEGAAALLAEVNYAIACCHIENGEYEEAVPYLEGSSLEAAASLLAEARFRLAQLAMEQADYAAAIAYLDDNSFEGTEKLKDEARYRLASLYMEAEDPTPAISLLEDNSYVYSKTLLREARNLSAAMQTEHFYNELLQQISAENPGTAYYMRLGDLLDETYAIIDRDGHLDNASAQFAEIFGKEPLSVEGAKSEIEELKEALQFEYFYDTPFVQHLVLDYLIEIWGRTSVYVHFEMTDSLGTMIIDYPYEFIKKMDISPKTLAYLLAACGQYGAQIIREGAQLTIAFPPTQPDGDYSRGYYHCAPDTQEQAITAFFMNKTFDFYDAYLTREGLGVTIEITTPTRYYLEYLSVDLMLRDKYGNYVAATSVLLEDISDMTVTFQVFFEGVTSQDLPDNEYMIWYFMAAVMNS